MNLSGTSVAQAVGGRLVAGGEVVANGVSTDTRTVRAGQLFVPLVGERFDGHDFLTRAMDAGASGAIVQAGVPVALGEGRIHVEVEDTLAALGDLARAHLARLAARRIAITGSNGKTTTKELAAVALAAYGETAKTAGNFNNLVGLPLTAFTVNETSRFALFEMGMNHPGEIARLTQIAAPEIGLVTSIGEAHLEGLKTIDAVIAAKGELYAGLAATGTAIVNMRDPGVVRAAEGTPARRRLRVGTGRDMDVSVEGIRRTGVAGLGATLVVRGKPYDLRLRTLGRHDVWNAALAVAILVALDLEPAAGIEALERFPGTPGRLHWRPARGGAVNVLDDSYNANPASMRAGLDTLAEIARKNGATRMIAVLGDMRELGERAPSLHEHVGAHAAAVEVDALFAVGRHAEDLARGFGDGVVCASDCAAILEPLARFVRAGDWVLVKGSHSLRMERAVQALLGEETT